MCNCRLFEPLDCNQAARLAAKLEAQHRLSSGEQVSLLNHLLDDTVAHQLGCPSSSRELSAELQQQLLGLA